MSRNGEGYSNGERELAQFRSISTDKILPFEGQPRSYFDENQLTALANSIETAGQKTPIIVTPHPSLPDTYILVDGERRWRAGRMISTKTGKAFHMNAIVEPRGSENEKYLSSVIANLHREDMLPLEIASSIQKLKDAGYTIAQLAEMYGKSPAWITSYTLLNGLNEKVKSLMDPHRGDNDRLKVATAIEIARIKDQETQLEIAYEVLERRLTHFDTMHLINSTAAKSVGSVAKRTARELRPSDEYRMLESLHKKFASSGARVLRSLQVLGEEMYKSRENGYKDLLKDIHSLEDLETMIVRIKGELNKVKRKL